jgi:hypothetical protein
LKFNSTAVAGLMAVVAAALGVTIAAPAHAAVFRFDTDPFAGSNAADPGRQIIGNELFIEEFSIATDVFSFNPSVFGAGDEVNFISDLSANLPDDGVNIIVLQDTPAVFAAGIAANLIAEQITTDGAGFFIYFNTTLDAPRLVFSTNLNDNTADLKVLARMTNLGPESLPDFTAANFALVPEPSMPSLLLGAGLAAGATFMRRRRARATHAGA